MADIPVIRSRNIAASMQKVLDTHQQIRERIKEHADEQAALIAARDERMNAEGKLNNATAYRTS